MAKVRIFGYRGISQVAQSHLRHFNSDSVFVTEEPYLWSQVIELNGATPVQSAVVADDQATLVRIEVPGTTMIRYEIQPNGPLANTARPAGDASPALSGFNLFQWFAGASISMVDGASFP